MNKQWNKTGESLPQIGQQVLICRADIIQMAQLMPHYGKKVWESESFFIDFDSVTHWMELPELPKE